MPWLRAWSLAGLLCLSGACEPQKTARTPNLVPFALVPMTTQELRVGSLHVISLEWEGAAAAESVVFEAELLPARARLDPITGEFQWRPQAHQTGSHVVQIRAIAQGPPSRRAGLSLHLDVVPTPPEQRVSSQEEPPLVENPPLPPAVNRAPVFDLPAAVQVQERSELVLPIVFFDPDGDAVELRSTPLPEGMVLDGVPPVLRWQPGFEQEGRYVLELVASDDGEPQRSSRVLLRVEVSGRNRPPVIDAPELVDAELGGALILPLRAMDPDGDDLSMRLITGPDGMVYDVEQGSLVWRPGVGQVGRHQVTVEVGDGGTPPLATRHELIIDVARPALEEPRCDRPMLEWPWGLPSLDLLLDGFEPVVGGHSAPVLELYPEPGFRGVPLTLRVCLMDPDGLGNLDVSSFSLFLNEAELASSLRWRRVGEQRLCGQLDRRCGEDVAGGRWHEAWGSIQDRDGRVGELGGLYGPGLVDPIRWQDVTEAVGLAEDSFTGNSHTGGVAWLDADEDGWPDLFVTGGAGTPNRLYRNLEGQGFEDVVGDGPLAMRQEAVAGVVYADVNNDGHEDLYVYSDHPVLAFMAPTPNPVPGDPNRLFLGDGAGGFLDVSEGSGLEDVRAEGQPFRTISAAFADYDRDGCMDLYAVHWRIAAEVDEEWDQDRLYRGDCEGHFEDVTEAAGLALPPRKGFVVLFADLNGDRWPDLYVGNQGWEQEHFDVLDDFLVGPGFTHDRLLVNQGNGRFVDQSEASGIGRDAVAAMGIDLADFDHDGDFDLFVTDVSEPVGYGNVFYRSLRTEEGALRYVNQAFQKGAEPLSGRFAWGVNAADFNNDGHEDLFVVGSGDRWVYAGDGQGEFVPMAWPLGPQAILRGEQDPSGIPQYLDGRGSAVADYDRDGDLDLAVWRHNRSVLLLRNETPREAHWLRIRLVPNRNQGVAVGALVELHSGSGDETLVQRRQLLAGTSQQSRSEAVLHFGLGARELVSHVDVYWPGSRMQRVIAPEIDQELDILQP